MCIKVPSQVLCFCMMMFVSQVSGTGAVLRNEILGSIQIRDQLTGMPELRLGLNDKVLFENTGS